MSKNNTEPDDISRKQDYMDEFAWFILFFPFIPQLYGNGKLKTERCSDKDLTPCKQNPSVKCFCWGCPTCDTTDGEEVSKC